MRAVQATAIEADIGDSLVARAASGDEVAFARIVAAHHDDMARVAFVVCRDVQLAQEAASAAWPIAWRKLSSVRDPAKLRPWLLAIAANEARGLVRQRRRSRPRRQAGSTGPVAYTSKAAGSGSPISQAVWRSPSFPGVAGLSLAESNGLSSLILA
jgi:DNA-directed RNA polymerase specialized sigma24 family protein